MPNSGAPIQRQILTLKKGMIIDRIIYGERRTDAGKSLELGKQAWNLGIILRSTSKKS